MTVALVLLDIQRGILQAPGLPWDDPATPDKILNAARRLLDEARDARRPVIHVGVARARRSGSFDAPRTAVADSIGKSPRQAMPLAPGTSDIEFLLAPREDEDRVYKIGVSAFQGTALDTHLRSQGVSDVLIAGAFTHMVVESTARQGFDLGYAMHVCADASCAPKQQIHDASLATGIPGFARVHDLEAALKLLRAGADD
jgi:nicotinamidase-related amidase